MLQLEQNTHLAEDLLQLYQQCHYLSYPYQVLQNLFYWESIINYK